MQPGIAAHDPLAAEVLAFWFDGARARPEWFAKDAAFDAEIRRRFLPLHEAAAQGRHDAWQEHPAECLALVIALDQFPRNMFRGEARAFATDARALEAARLGVDRGYDAAMRSVERLFLYLPFEHSESLEDQWRSLALIAPLAAWPETSDVFGWTVRHWEIIRRFGRYPHRNAALGRPSTPAEIEFLGQPGSGF